MQIHYYELFGKWKNSDDCTWMLELRDAHATLTARFESGQPVLQPNPWRGQEIETNSKRYLSRLIQVFSIAPTSGPGDVVFAACTRAMTGFGTRVELLKGKPKKEQRILQKARACSYDAIRDYSRLSIIVHDLMLLPAMVQQLSSCPEFDLVRAKNRLDPAVDADESAGYRDYQLLARVAGDGPGWIVEIQIIPQEMYKLKADLGHAGYTKYRCVRSCLEPARAIILSISALPRTRLHTVVHLAVQRHVHV